MDDVYIAKGKLAGKGVYAARDFESGEIVKYYNLRPLTQAEFDQLPTEEHMFVHSFFGKMYLFPEPSRYTNHSPTPNTRADLERMCDIAILPIKRGEMITTNATKEVENELRTFIEALEHQKVLNFQRINGGYRNATCSYSVERDNEKLEKTVKLKRIRGNWHIV